MTLPPDGSPVPDAHEVLRLVAPDSTGGMGAAPVAAIGSLVTDATFELSSADKASKPPSFSVWDTERTTATQAFDIGCRESAGGTRRTVAIIVAVKVIGTLIVSFRGAEYGRDRAILDVRYRTRWRDEGSVPDDSPGADGHAGIEGLHPGLGDTNNDRKAFRKVVRVYLANAWRSHGRIEAVAA